MLLLGKPAGRFRLVVRRDDREYTCSTLVFDHYKQAVAHVARAVCDHTCDDDIPDAVLLQRADRATDTRRREPARPEHWLEIERWGSDVIRRIVCQHRAAFRMPDRDMRSAARPAAPTRRRAPATAVPQPTEHPRLAHAEPFSRPAAVQSLPKGAPAIRAELPRCAASGPCRRTRWGRRAYIAAAAIMLALGWLTIVVWMTGGHPADLIRGMENAAEAAPAAEVLFEAPPPVNGR